MRIPTIVCPDDEATREGWALFRTGAHTAWHIEGVYATEQDARLVAARYGGDPYTDGLVIRKVSFEPAVMRWEKKWP